MKRGKGEEGLVAALLSAQPGSRWKTAPYFYPGQRRIEIYTFYLFLLRLIDSLRVMLNFPAGIIGDERITLPRDNLNIPGPYIKLGLQFFQDR